MALVQKQFEKRLRRIVKNHNRMSNGVTHRIDSNGLIVAHPRIYNPKFPLRGLVLLIGTAFVFKGYVFAVLGAATYSDRLAGLQDGAWFERAGAWIMQADPVTRMVAQAFQSLGL